MGVQPPNSDAHKGRPYGMEYDVGVLFVWV